MLLVCLFDLLLLFFFLESLPLAMSLSVFSGGGDLLYVCNVCSTCLCVIVVIKKKKRFGMPDEEVILKYLLSSFLKQKRSS